MHIKHDFKKSGNGKRSKKRLILTIVALVEILLILVVSTSAWVETVSTIRIYTTANSEPGQPAQQTGRIMTHNNQVANVSPSSTASIDISQLIHESGEAHVTAASSANGKDIFFPSADNGVTANYRAADISDNMTNYISVSFKVKNAASFVFDTNPTIKFGSTTISSGSLVRVSIGVNNTTWKIFSKSAVTNGTVVNSATGSTGPTNVSAFSSYTSGNASAPVVTVSANDILTVKVWVQDPTFTSSTTYTGQKLTITNLKLVPCYRVTANASVNNANASGTSAASVQLGTSSTSLSGESSSIARYFKYGAKPYFKANNKNTTDYSFLGWYTATNGGTRINANPAFASTSGVTGTITYYARFVGKVNITAKSVVGQTTTASTTGGTVKIGDSAASSTVTSQCDYGSSVTLTAIPNSDYSVIGWYKGGVDDAHFISGTNGQTTYTISSATEAATYYVSFKQKTTTTIYMTYRGYSKMRVYVWGKSTNQHYLGDFGTSGNKPTYTGTRGLYSISFTTAEDEDIGIIVYDGDDSENKRSEYTAHTGNTCLIAQAGSSINTSFSLGTKRYIYFTKQWSTNKLHYWGGTIGSSTWNTRPTMTSVAYTNTYNQNVLYYVINTGNTAVIFDNGSGTQTGDTTLGSNSCFYFVNANAAAGTWAPSTD